MQRWTVVFLVLLRLSIGWHFLFEGITKIRSHVVGPTVTSKPFSSSGYFQEAPGPLGQAFRHYNGDPDELAIARLVTPERTGDPANDKPHARLPAGLRRDWEGLTQRFAKHYGLKNDAVQAVLDQHASQAVNWLEYEPDPLVKDILTRFGKIELVDVSLLNEKERAAYESYLANSSDQTRTFSTGDVTRRMTMPERIADYRAKLADLRDRSGRKLWLFSRDVEGARLRTAKAEVAKLRDGLMADLAQTQTASLIQSLNSKVLGSVGDVLTKVMGSLKGDELKTATDAVKMPTTPIDPASLATPLGELVARLTRLAEDKARPAEETKNYSALAKSLADAIKDLPEVGVLPAPPADRWQEKADWALSCTMAVVGACVLIGFLTRINCWLAAMFLLMTYLAVPSMPWLPAVGPQEGNYVFVNKNVVEFFALCVLGTLPTGRWFGADGLLIGLWNFLIGTPESDTQK